MSIIVTVIIVAVIAVAVGVGIGYMMRKQTAEAQIGSAEQEALRIG